MRETQMEEKTVLVVEDEPDVQLISRRCWKTLDSV